MKIHIEIEIKDDDIKYFIRETMQEIGWAIFKKVSEK